MEREWTYTVVGPAQAEIVIRQLDVLPEEVLVGMGVFVQGDPAKWYVYVNSDNASAEQITYIEVTLEAVGDRTRLSLQDLLRLRPHFTATGPSDHILSAISLVDADGYERLGSDPSHA